MAVKERYQLPFILAIVLHLAILAAFIFSFVFQGESVQLPGSQTQIINAIALNSAQVQEQLAAFKAHSSPKKIIHPQPHSEPMPMHSPPRPIEKPKMIRPKPMVKPAEPPKPEIKKIEKPLEKPVKEAENHPELKVNDQAKIKLDQAKLKNEVKKEKTKPVPKPKIQAKETAKPEAKPEIKPQKNLEKIIDQKDIADKKSDLQNALAQELNQDKQAEKAQDAKDLLQQNLKADQQQLQAAASKYQQGVVDKYKALMLSAIEQHWRVPPNLNKDLSCDLLITLAPGGSVLTAEVTRSSGVPALDRSAIQAVYQASPLPVPSDPDVFATMRQITITAKPENISAG